MRPTNPTPAHATGNGTPTPVRPTNPTPSQASAAVNPRPSNPTPRQASELLSQESPLQGDSPHWRTNLESVQEVDVPSSVGEDVQGPVEAEDPDDEENVPMFSGEKMTSIAATAQKFLSSFFDNFLKARFNPFQGNFLQRVIVQQQTQTFFRFFWLKEKNSLLIL